MYIYKRKRGDSSLSNHLVNNQKKLFDMVKDTKSSPASKRNGVKKIFYTVYQLITNNTLTAMP
jgi:hypothetical protein